FQAAQRPFRPPSRRHGLAAVLPPGRDPVARGRPHGPMGRRRVSGAAAATGAGRSPGGHGASAPQHTQYAIRRTRAHASHHLGRHCAGSGGRHHRRAHRPRRPGGLCRQAWGAQPLYAGPPGPARCPPFSHRKARHMSQASRESPPDTLADPLLEGFGALINTVFGADPLTRARTGAVLLSAVMYAICCGAAWMAAGIGTILPDAPAVLLAVCLPAHALFYVLIRSGRTRQCKDPALILPQNLLALLGVSFAYTAVGPNDRGLVLMLVCLIMVFGMYTHQTPKQSVQVGVTAMVLLGACMGVLSHWDPLYYPPHLELLRFE